MSVTTTDNPVTTGIQFDHLEDYNIRLTSGPSDNELAQQQSHVSPPNTDNSAIRPLGAVENPPGWDDQYRQVPPYRPVNTNLDHDQRPWGSNGIETAFVFHMLHGVWLNSTISWVWRKTGGRVNDQIFRYKIGGEI